MQHLNPMKQALPVIEKNLGIFIVKQAAQWAMKELQYKGHHLTFDNLKQLHDAFKPLFEVDEHAIYCFAHQRSKEQNDPQQDIIFPEYSKAILALPKIDRHAAEEVRRSLATMERYLTDGLGFKHGKLHRTGNYSEAVAGGILTWCRHRLPYWINQCLQDPHAIEKIFPALLQALSKVQAQPGAKEKHGIIEDLKLTIKKDLVPALERLVANLSAAEEFEAMQKDAEQAAMDLRKLGMALSDQRYTQDQPDLRFTTDRSLAKGFVSEAAGGQLIKKVTQHLVPRVPLNAEDPIAHGIQQSAVLAIEGQIETVPAKQWVLSPPQRQQLAKHLHPACRQQVHCEHGSKQQTLRELDDNAVDQAITHLQALLISADRLSAIAALLAEVAGFAKFAGSKAMFDPKALQQTLATLKQLLDAEQQAILKNPLLQQVEHLMDCGAFVKAHETCLHYGNGKATPNLKLLTQSIQQRLKSLYTHWQKIDYQRVHFAEAVANNRERQLKITKGLHHLSGGQSPIGAIANELAQASEIKPNPSQDGGVLPLELSTQQALQKQLVTQLHQLCQWYDSPAIHRKRYYQFLSKMFKGTGVTLQWKKDGWTTYHLTYDLAPMTSKDYAKLAHQIQEHLAQVVIRTTQPPLTKKVLDEQAGWDAVTYQHLCALYRHLHFGHDLTETACRELLNQCVRSVQSRTNQTACAKMETVLGVKTGYIKIEGYGKRARVLLPGANDQPNRYQSGSNYYRQLKERVKQAITTYVGNREQPIMISHHKPLNGALNQLLDDILKLDEDDEQLKTKLSDQLVKIMSLQEDQRYTKYWDPLLFAQLLHVVFKDTGFTFYQDDKKLWRPRQSDKPVNAKKNLGRIQVNIEQLRLAQHQPVAITNHVVMNQAVLAMSDQMSKTAQTLSWQQSDQRQTLINKNEELESQLILANRHKKKFENLYTKAVDDRVKDIKVHQNEIQKSINELSELRKSNEQDAELVEEQKLRLNELSHNLQKLSITNLEQENELKELRKTQKQLSLKNQQLIKLLETTMSETLVGITSIIDNCKQSLLDISKVKIELNQKNKSGVSDCHQELVELKAIRLSNINRKQFLSDFIKEIELSIQKNEKISNQLKINLENALTGKESCEIKQEISKLEALAKRRLDSIQEKIKTQADIVKILRNTINALQNENERLSKIIDQKQNQINELEIDKKNMKAEYEKKLNLVIQQKNGSMQICVGESH